ncbi:uncharacterized protein LOC143274746 [Babylonia areolata]|uniref:uncharacterized protein LOC143274746 n=1 Tax=Babylonia areolata TaxID=304850 RepID=UPI003FD3EA31
MMPGGANCAIVGCPAQKAKNRGLSFHVIPKKGNNNKWRDAMIQKINRADRGFNPDRATVCSRHFRDSCFRYGPNGVRSLIPGSLPTEFMPCKSVETPRPPPRKPLTSRPPPELPERVAYYTFEEVQRDAQRLPAPWCLLSNDSTQLTVAIVDLMLDQVKLKALISSDFTVDLFVLGKKVPNVTDSVEKTKLHDFLKNVAAAKMCTGTTDPDLQQYADVLDKNSKQVYYREACSSGSVVRSVNCVVMFQGATDLETCGACRNAKRLLVKKKNRALASASKPVSKHDSLRFISKEKLSCELKSLRKMNKNLQEF